MKRKIFLTIGLIFIVSAISFLSSNVRAYTAFNPVVSGDHLYWEVLDYNETNNLVEPGDWLDEFYLHRGFYTLNIGDNVLFKVDSPSACNGTIEIGNLTLSSVTRHEIGLSLMLITGPAFPTYTNYSFDPAFISPTNWQTQIEIANNATNERTFSSMTIGTSYKVFLGLNRSVISFNFTWGDQISKTIYDNETGLLLYMYTKFQLHWFEMVITIPSGIPAFEIYLSIFTLSVLILIPYYKRRSKILSGL